ncbi:TRAP-T family transporter, DctM (12 TMs) subunit [Pseudooceanicola batsensis HTCC2597]|uniref:TRAP transporter large permease protein n=1 Tax=Pseudooceanicola batsensis (strain ATCC BAA-863 / DSM 15984 / KCTC 12145 / HTCC2597) TaxID=252305 RepID=A3TSQ3_PSEBH|nr:TRAP transporter large permease [Pseudooceanicola batsensis]EAQ04680.1 TRAP-T family transporter, DctM (12 TMs) subunit [Pseudooceanicola batsensis HTCC2597]
MTGVELGLAVLGLLIVLIALRMPIGVALIGVSFLGLWQLTNWRIAWGSLGLIPHNFAANWVLSSVPMFLLLGFISYQTRLTEGLFRAARAWLSVLPGGLAIASILGSAGFAAVSGSSIACSATMGRIAVPEMLKSGYHPQLATGTVAVAGTIGALIPPSVIMILYGIVAQVPVTHLFLGGIAAGVLTALGYIAVVMIRVTLDPLLAPSTDDRASWSERIAALRETWPVLLIMLGIFSGLFGGVFTPTEAGAVGATLATLTAILKGSFTLRRFTDAITETVLTTGALIIIGVGASLLTRFLALSGTGDFLSGAILASGAGPMTILLGVILVYLLLGMFLEPIGAMLLTLPIILPVIDGAGFDLLWFGIIVTKLLEIGMITPPIGMNVFVIKGIVPSHITTAAIFRGIWWFLVMDLVLLAVLVLFPGLVMYLPAVFG